MNHAGIGGIPSIPAVFVAFILTNDKASMFLN